MVRRTIVVATLALLVSSPGCEEDRPKAAPPAMTPTSGVASTTSSGGSEDTGASCPAGGCDQCELPHAPCEGDITDAFKAMGLTCPDRGIDPDTELQYTLDADAAGIAPKLGAGSTYLPREGDTLMIMGTGKVSELRNGGECNHTWLEQYYQDTQLPEPILVNKVGNVTCEEDPNLVGTGDCSNTIWDQFSQGEFVHDYMEFRFTTQVPSEATAVKFDFAFMSTEYPEFYGEMFNDMFIVWLESEGWTGNVSFDEEGNPISLNAGFLDYKDDAQDLAQFEGTCMRGHGGTRWLTSQAEVAAGEEITMVFAIFDLSDGQYDSFVLLDNFRWGCDEDGGGPSTMPGGTGDPEPSTTGSTGATGSTTTSGP